jgi:hypothetical protein
MENLTRVCTKCNVEQDLEENFYRKVRGKLGRSSECKECIKARMPVWRKENKSQPTSKAKMRNGLLTFGERDKKVEKQNNQCLICETVFTEEIKPNVDHNHKTGKVRGILCRECNLGLGYFKDSATILAGAIKYLLKKDYRKR